MFIRTHSGRKMSGETSKDHPTAITIRQAIGRSKHWNDEMPKVTSTSGLCAGIRDENVAKTTKHVNILLLFPIVRIDFPWHIALFRLMVKFQCKSLIQMPLLVAIRHRQVSNAATCALSGFCAREAFRRA